MHKSILKKITIFMIVVSFTIISLGFEKAYASPFSFFGNKAKSEANILSKHDIEIYKKAVSFAKRKQWSNARAEALKAKNQILLPYIKWLELLDSDSKVSFDVIADFINQHPTWPRIHSLRRNAETSINETTPKDKIKKWFEVYPPLSAEGMMYFAKTLGQDNKQAQVNEIIKDIWINYDFSDKFEKIFLSEYGTKITEDDNIKRIDRLLWDTQITQARRVIPRVSKDYITLFNARIALIRNSKGVDTLVNNVNKRLLDNSGLVFERAKWRRRRGNIEGAYEMHIHKSATKDNPEKWWSERNIMIRESLKTKKYARAYKLASEHGLDKGEAFSEAEWLSGWLSLRFLNQEQKAFNHFKNMHDSVFSPVSIARAAYWCGRALEAIGKDKEARKWYEKSSAHTTTFYGQLASARVDPFAEAPLHKTEKVSPLVIHSLKQQEVAQILKALLEINDTSHTSAFAISLLNTAKTPELINAVLYLFENYFKKTDFAVSMARRARHLNGIILIENSYPIKKFEDINDADLPLVLSIIRQESNFNNEAKSPAGARGLMQLMPATARNIAKELKIKYDLNKLTTDPNYNIRLGSYYIKKRIDNFDGSYVLAIAAYNAGHRNVVRWISEYGDPRTSAIDILDWIELIPFGETRNYVQRVLENLQVYRRLIKNDDKLATNLESNLSIK